MIRVSLLALFFFLAIASGDDVLDIDGNKLEANARYAILPVMRGFGGGVTYAPGRGNGSCGVVQDRFEVSRGTPVVFLPANAAGGVQISSDINIKFSETYPRRVGRCSSSSLVWKREFDEETQKYFVTTGGKVGIPGPTAVLDWFRIEKFGDDYKLNFCPSVCNFCKFACGDVGVYFEKGIRRLVLSDVPFRVMFKKM